MAVIACGPGKMRDTLTHFWGWYWRERTGALLFRHLRGARRLTFEVPVLLLGGYAWYLYLFSLPAIGRSWVLSMVSNPFGLVGILCIAAYEIGINTSATKYLTKAVSLRA